MKKSVFGILKSRDQAENVVDRLKGAGFSNEDISVLFPDTSGTRDFAHEQETKAPEGATTGGTTGFIVGGVLGWLAGIGSLAIPGIGPFIAAGPIMAALSGAAVGTAIGGIAGALIGMGIPEYEAKRYESKIKEGNILVSVHADNNDEADRAKDILEAASAEDVATSGEAGVPRGSREAGTTTAATTTPGTTSSLGTTGSSVTGTTPGTVTPTTSSNYPPAEGVAEQPGTTIRPNIQTQTERERRDL
jgi:cell division septation protein DedD